MARFGNITHKQRTRLAANIFHPRDIDISGVKDLQERAQECRNNHELRGKFVKENIYMLAAYGNLLNMKSCGNTGISFVRPDGERVYTTVERVTAALLIAENNGNRVSVSVVQKVADKFKETVFEDTLKFNVGNVKGMGPDDNPDKETPTGTSENNNSAESSDTKDGDSAESSEQDTPEQNTPVEDTNGPTID